MDDITEAAARRPRRFFGVPALVAGLRRRGRAGKQPLTRFSIEKSR